MGTRALTTIKNSEDQTVLVMYRQSDGYQDAHGFELKEFLSGRKLIDGIPFGEDNSMSANGMGCLAAQLVSHLKDNIGLHYIYPEGVADGWVDFKYTIYPSGDSDSPELMIKVESYDDVLFNGLVSDYEAKDTIED